MLLIDQGPNANPVRLVVPDNAAFTPSGDFTLEFFGLKFTSTAGQQCVWGHYSTAGSNRSLLCDWLSGTGWRCILSNDGSATTTISYNNSPSTGVEYNMCFERSGSTVRIYVDGTMGNSGTKGSGLFNAARDACVGNFDNAGAYNSSPFLGTCKAIRFTVGVARYATDTSYSVPTLPLPTT